jgi:nucleoid DNA-binding protein
MFSNFIDAGFWLWQKIRRRLGKSNGYETDKTLFGSGGFMNKAQLVDVVQRELGREVSKAAAERALDAVLNAIKKGVQSGGEVQLVGFGTFRVSKRAARMGRNPKTGEQIQIKASKTVRFSAGQGLKQSL